MGFEFKGRRPDILDLVIPLDHMSDVAFTEAESDEDHQVIFYKGNLLGVVLPASDYHRWHEISTEGKVVISLAASCSVEFEHLLRSLLSSVSGGWTLICERDCDQEPVVKFDYEQISAREILEQLFAFLKGIEVECPTFMIVKNA